VTEQHAPAQPPFQEWCVVELMGHVRMAGLVSEEERFGVKVGRIDVPIGDAFTTIYFGGSSIYRVTPTTEEIARSVAKRNEPQPVHRFELPALPSAGPAQPSIYDGTADYGDEDDDSYDGTADYGDEDDDSYDDDDEPGEYPRF